ncbi:MAG: TIGR03032 family protein [Rhodospirillales bacterium]
MSDKDIPEAELEVVDQETAEETLQSGSAEEGGPDGSDEGSRDSANPDGSEEEEVEAKKKTSAVTPSEGFAAWMREMNASIAFSTYQASRLLLIGPTQGEKVRINESSFERCLGLWGDGESLWVATLFQIWRLDNLLMPGKMHKHYDRVYVPRMGYVTSNVDAHDLALNADGECLFANTAFSCLARTSPSASFVPIWRPNFITQMKSEDRCHLNGLAMRDGRAAFMTAIAESDEKQGWRELRGDGGLILSIADSEIVYRGLCMPHSPRWHDGKLWVINSGLGELGYLEPNDWQFRPVALLPGYGRGLTFIGDYAVVGVSMPRDMKTFGGLPLDDVLEEAGLLPKCGLVVVNLKTGTIDHHLWIEGHIVELYDVTMLEGVRSPMALDFNGKEIKRWIKLGRPGID